jgi:hypothetical protein
MMIFKSIARFLLKQKTSEFEKRDRNAHFNFKAVKSVGIVFSADNTVQIETIRKYMTAINNSGKRVSAICFYQDKELPVLQQSGLLIDFVLPKEVDFWGVPKPSFVEGFIENKFDLLLDLDINGAFPVEHVSAMSKALFKVGRYSESNEGIFDMMLEIDDSKDLSFFIEQVDVYLKMMNKND